MRSLTEAIRAKDFDKAIQTIARYLKSKTGGKVYAYPEPEVFRPAGGPKLVGIRLFISNGGYKSMRFNWKNVGSLGSFGLVSIDYWDGSKTPQPIPTKHVEFDVAQQLVKVLPIAVDIINGSLADEGYFINESVGLQYIPMITDFSAVRELNEASYSSGDIAKTVANVIHALSQGISPGDQHKAGGAKKYGAGWNKVIDAIKQIYPGVFQKQGVKILIDTAAASKIDVNRILAGFGADSEVVAYSTSAGTKEEIEVEGTSEADLDRLTYEEQLDSLKTAMKLLMSNATQQIYLAGRGGTGKTQNVEDELHAAGKTDGNGYYKVTGSASTAGIYRVMFQNRKNILLFDDSDGALADQDSRNLFKAASDTKKVRKISWQKGGKNYVDADAYNWDEEGEQDELPRSFEFTGKIIFISNLSLNKLDPDGALRTRGYVLNIDPTNAEIYEFMEKIAPKINLDVDYDLSNEERIEVVEILRARRLPEKTANLRTLVRALNTRAGVEMMGGSSDEWKKFALRFA